MAVPLTTKILLADDHAVVRRGLQLVLDSAPDLSVVAEAGASGYVLKTVTGKELVEACRAAMRGEPFLSPPTVATRTWRTQSRGRTVR